MEQLIRRILEGGLAEFEGLHVSGTVPMKQELLNEIIAEVLKNGLPIPGSSGISSSEASTGSGGGGSRSPRLPINDLLKIVKRAEVRATEGKITLDFEIQR